VRRCRPWNDRPDAGILPRGDEWRREEIEKSAGMATGSLEHRFAGGKRRCPAMGVRSRACDLSVRADGRSRLSTSHIMSAD